LMPGFFSCSRRDRHLVELVSIRGPDRGRRALLTKHRRELALRDLVILAMDLSGLIPRACCSSGVLPAPHEAALRCVYAPQAVPRLSLAKPRCNPIVDRGGWALSEKPSVRPVTTGSDQSFPGRVKGHQLTAGGPGQKKNAVFDHRRRFRRPHRGPRRRPQASQMSNITLIGPAVTTNFSSAPVPGRHRTVPVTLRDRRRRFRKARGENRKNLSVCWTEGLRAFNPGMATPSSCFARGNNWQSKGLEYDFLVVATGMRSEYFEFIDVFRRALRQASRGAQNERRERSENMWILRRVRIGGDPTDGRGKNRSGPNDLRVVGAGPTGRRGLAASIAPIWYR